MPNLSKNDIKSTKFILSSSSSSSSSSMRESRRRAVKATVPDDPLGLLSSPSSSQLPEWLIGGGEAAAAAAANLEKCENIPIDDDDDDAVKFETLIKGQVDRQAALETQIKSQQARTDNYIQTLMRHSTSAVRSEDVRIQNLEIERNNLQHLVEIFKEKHKQEIKILQDSQEMQLGFMHKAVEQLEKECARKIERLSNEKDELEKNFKIQIDNLKANHEQTLREINARHSDQLLLIQKEYSETVGGISHAKDIERQTIHFIQTNTTDLEKIFQRSQYIFDTFQSISETIKTRDNSQEKYLELREEKLQAAIQELDNERRNLDLERKQIESTVQKLQSDTTKLSRQLEKNLELFYEREKALMRERELLQEQNKWERDHLQSLKETWIKLLLIKSDDMARQAADQERNQWLDTREKQLTQRAIELEQLTKATLIKRKEGLRALQEAQRLERQYKNLTSQVEKPEKDKINVSTHQRTQFETHFKDIVDPELLLLKL